MTFVKEYIKKLNYIINDPKTNMNDIHHLVQLNRMVINNLTKQRGGADSIDDLIRKANEMNSKLKNMISPDSKFQIDKKQITEDIEEIGETAISLITFLGEMIKINNDPALQQMQEQITDIVLSLGKYLD
jgi:hypothetical protein